LKNKRVLITGGAGFIGSHLVKRLVRMGNDVSVVVKYNSVVDNVRLSAVWNDLHVLEADLRNIDSLRQFKSKSFDVIFHLAAYNHVGDSFLHVNESLMSNTIGTANLLEFGPNFDRFVYISTSEVYGFQNNVPFREEMIPFPISPYAIGKYAGELYAKMKRRQTKQSIVCVRPFNTFGPYQSERAVIPELINKCLIGVPVETTQGQQTREFNYVDNQIDGLLAAAVGPDFEEVINIGSGMEIKICDLVKIIHTVCDSKSEIRIGAIPDRPTEIWRMCSDNNRARTILNWEPKISFNEGVTLTVEWYKDYIKCFYSKDSLLNIL